MKETHQEETESISVAIGRLVAIDPICLPIAIADAVGLAIRANGFLSKPLQQDIGHHPVLILDLILCKLHDHEGLGRNLFGEQEASKTFNILEMLPSLEECFKLATDHGPGSMAW